MTEKINGLLHEELVFFQVEANSREELLNKLSDELYIKNYVKDTFKEAVLEREQIFPTGLPTAGVKVAIPHTDAVHVIKPAIVIATLKNSIIFKEMGLGENDIDVELVIMMAINNPSEQVNTLSKLMGIFSNEELLKKIKDSKQVDEVLALIGKEVS